MPSVPLGTVFLSELVGTALLLFLGCGVVANVALARTKGAGGGFLLVNFGWGMAVFAGVYAASRSGAHLNPAVTVGLLAKGSGELAPGVATTAPAVAVYLAADMLGAMAGAVLCWLAYKQHFDATEDLEAKRGVFCNTPAIRHVGWNLTTEVLATFVLVFTVLEFGRTPSGLGPLAVAMLVIGIGACLGGPTGYAINPVRDLGPRLVHALVPLGRRAPSDWAYAWIPVVGPLLGGVLAGLASAAYR